MKALVSPSSLSIHEANQFGGSTIDNKLTIDNKKCTAELDDEIHRLSSSEENKT